MVDRVGIRPFVNNTFSGSTTATGSFPGVELSDDAASGTISGNKFAGGNADSVATPLCPGDLA